MHAHKEPWVEYLSLQRVLLPPSSSIGSDKPFLSSTDTKASYVPYHYYHRHYGKFQLFTFGLSFLKIEEGLALVVIG